MTTFALAAASLLAPEALTPRQAVEPALQSNPLGAAADASEKAAGAGIRRAQSGYLPRVQFSESVQHGNNPVFVYSPRLIQRQFGERNVGIDARIRPNALTNYQSRLTVAQAVFGARQIFGTRL